MGVALLSWNASERSQLRAPNSTVFNGASDKSRRRKSWSTWDWRLNLWAIHGDASDAAARHAISAPVLKWFKVINIVQKITSKKCSSVSLLRFVQVFLTQTLLLSEAPLHTVEFAVPSWDPSDAFQLSNVTPILEFYIRNFRSKILFK